MISGDQSCTWFREGASNYVILGDDGTEYEMLAAHPLLGLTDSGDALPVLQELQWRHRYMPGSTTFVQWQRPGDLSDRNLRNVWLPLFRRHCPAETWGIFYDPGLAAQHRGISGANDWSRPDLLDLLRGDLAALADLLADSQYATMGGRPAIWVWGVGTSMGRPERALELLEAEGLAVMADVFGVDPGTVRLPATAWATGFTIAIPGHAGTVPYDVAAQRIYQTGEAWERATGGRVIWSTSPAFHNHEHRDAIISTGKGSPPHAVSIRGTRGQVEAHYREIRRRASGRPVWLGTWNNCPEDTHLIPTVEDGFWRLEMVRDLFYPQARYAGPRLERKRRRNRRDVVRGTDVDVMATMEPSGARFDPRLRHRWRVHPNEQVRVRNLDGLEATA